MIYRPAEWEQKGKLDDLISLCYFVVRVCRMLFFCVALVDFALHAQLRNTGS